MSRTRHNRVAIQRLIAVRMREQVDANIQSLAGNATYTSDDPSLLVGYSAEALESDSLKRMRVD